MDLHINKHHKNQPRPDLTCMLCETRAQSKDKLKKHMEKYHQVVSDD